MFDSWIGGVTTTSIICILYMAIMMSNSESVIMSMNNAKVITKDEYPEIYNIVEEISLVAGLKQMPKIYIIQEDSPNAFATGLSPEKSAIAVTTALVEKLNREELEGVIAHEISHIVGYDCRLSTVTLSLISAILILTDFFWLDAVDDVNPVVLVIGVIFIILSPIIGYAIHYALSRNREYQADAMAINFTRNPLALKNALLKIDNDPDIVDDIPPGCAAMYISDPLKKQFKDGKKVKKASLFSTHPSIESRVDRLESM